MNQPVQTKPPRSGPPPLSREMSKLLANLAKKSGAMDPVLAERWHEIAGPQMARLCRPVRLRKTGRARALEVAAANGAAAMQLQFRQQELLDSVNRVLGKGAVTRITIRQTGKAAMAAGRSGSGTAGGFSQPLMPADTDPAPVPKAGEKSTDLSSALERMRGLIERRGE